MGIISMIYQIMLKGVIYSNKVATLWNKNNNKESTYNVLQNLSPNTDVKKLS